MAKRILALLLTLMLLPALAQAASKPSIKFSYKVGMLYVGEEYTLKPRLKRTTADQLQWASSNRAIVDVDAGKLTGVRMGIAAVKAEAGGSSAVCGVVVLEKELSLEKGSTLQLPYQKSLKYATSNKKVAAVSKKGLVAGVGVGSAKITVRYGSVKKSVTITVGEKQPEPAAPENQSKADQLDCADSTRQIVLVEYQGGSSARVSFHQKVNGLWKELASVNGYVGKNGIGKTREGDKKTPTGTFNLTTPFGIQSDPGAKMPYTEVTKTMYWCGDSSSQYYNQFCDSKVNGRKATSSDEVLYRYKGVYDYCLFIDYNAQGTPGKGSCIFLHCMGSNKYTAGCVAIPKNAMKQVLRWAEAGCKIVIQ